ncbi:hypothetical protein Tco_0628962 [Tanacetum coccineum]|uniref:Uncharacterized protein n=1 Tax=Tanacetum coccineum TaxID=301880 RepID=A0ABQ4WRR9_9ASTR
MKRTKVLYSREAAAADCRKAYSKQWYRNQSRRNPTPRVASRKQLTAAKGAGEERTSTPLTMTPKEILACRKVQNFPKPHQCADSRGACAWDGYCEYSLGRRAIYNECVPIAPAIDNIGQGRQIGSPVMETKEIEAKDHGTLRYARFPSTAHEYVKFPVDVGITGVPRSSQTQLKIRQVTSPVRQKKRGQAPERAKAILEETCLSTTRDEESGVLMRKVPLQVLLGCYKAYHQIQMWQAMTENDSRDSHESECLCYTKMPLA